MNLFKKRNERSASAERERALQPLADALSLGIRSHNTLVLTQAMSRLARLSEKDLYLLLGMLDPDVFRELSQAMVRPGTRRAPAKTL